MPDKLTSTQALFAEQASMQPWKDETVSELRSPPEWSTPHSTVKFLPLEVTMVLLEVGQEISAVVVEATQDVFW